MKAWKAYKGELSRRQILKKPIHICEGSIDTYPSFLQIFKIEEYFLKKDNFIDIICWYQSLKTIEWPWTNKTKK